MTCSSQQLCELGQDGPDDGGIPQHCVDVPPTCLIYDCDTVLGPACSSCILDLCGCPPGVTCTINVHGRMLSC